MDRQRDRETDKVVVHIVDVFSNVMRMRCCLGLGSEGWKSLGRPSQHVNYPLAWPRGMVLWDGWIIKVGFAQDLVR